MGMISTRTGGSRRPRHRGVDPATHPIAPRCPLDRTAAGPMADDPVVRRLLLPLIAAATIAAAATPAGAASPLLPYDDAVAYRANLSSPDDGRSWNGTQTITVRNSGAGPLNEVWLRVWANGVVGCHAPAIDIAVTGGGDAGRVQRDCTALEINLPEPLAPRQQTTITLALTIAAPTFADRFGTTAGIHLFGNALPVVAQRDRASWRLPRYSTYGESFVSSVASFDLSLEHAADVRVAASGHTTTATNPSDPTRVTTTSRIRARDAAWAAGNMVETRATSKRGVIVRGWAPPYRRASAERSARRAALSIDRIEKRLPRYPHGELDVIIADINAGGGMEYPALVTTNGDNVVTRHEVAHQWFYATVGNDQYREPWVDEGIASFIEYSWTQGEAPISQCIESRLLVYRNDQSFAAQTMTYWNQHPRQYGVVYHNPVCALRDQRRLLGERRFNAVLRRLVTRHRNAFLTGAQVRRAFRRAGGPKAEAIWARWALAPRGG